jgi:hypothetical protein
VAHAYNPSYSGDRDQEDWGLKKPITKQGWWSGSRCRLLVKTPVLQKEKKKKERKKIINLNMTCWVDVLHFCGSK